MQEHERSREEHVSRDGYRTNPANASVRSSESRHDAGERHCRGGELAPPSGRRDANRPRCATSRAECAWEARQTTRVGARRGGVVLGRGGKKHARRAGKQAGGGWGASVIVREARVRAVPKPSFEPFERRAARERGGPRGGCAQSSPSSRPRSAARASPSSPLRAARRGRSRSNRGAAWRGLPRRLCGRPDPPASARASLRKTHGCRAVGHRGDKIARARQTARATARGARGSRSAAGSQTRFSFAPSRHPSACSPESIVATRPPMPSGSLALRPDRAAAIARLATVPERQPRRRASGRGGKGEGVAVTRLLNRPPSESGDGPRAIESAGARETDWGDRVGALLRSPTAVCRDLHRVGMIIQCECAPYRPHRRLERVAAAPRRLTRLFFPLPASCSPLHPPFSSPPPPVPLSKAYSARLVFYNETWQLPADAKRVRTLVARFRTMHVCKHYSVCFVIVISLSLSLFTPPHLPRTRAFSSFKATVLIGG